MTTISASSNNGVNLNTGFYSNPIVINHGVDLTGDFGGYAIYAASGIWTITNAGQISDSANGAGIFLGGGGTVTNQSNGVIASFVATATGIYFQNGAGTVTNLGTIDAGIWLQDGGAVTNALGARIVSDSTSGGYGVGLHVGGSVTNAGEIIGGFVGVDANHLGGTVTNQTGGTITGHYAGVAMGVAGLRIQDQPLAGGRYVINQAGGTISGDTGFIAGGNSATVTNAGTIAGTFAGTFSPGGVTLVVGAGVSMSAGGSVTNQSGGTIIGASYGVYISGGAGTVANSGSIAGGSGSGVELTDGGLVTNAGTATISSAQRDGIYIKGATGTVTNAGDIAASLAQNIFLKAGGTVINQSTGTITNATFTDAYIGGGSGTVINAGVMIVSGTSHAAVGMFGGGLVSNAGTGTISSNGHAAVYIKGAAGTVINAGHITNAATSAVVLEVGGTVTNQATATISGSLYGVSIFGAAGTVVNAGVIAASHDGVGLLSGGTVVDRGTITGGADAVYFAAGFANRLVVDPGAVFNGTVTGGNTLGAPVVSTLELASGASAGSLTNLGSTIVNFGSIAFDNGADWFIAGNTAGLAGTISGFAQGDTIEVTGITVTGSNFSSGILTLTEASGSATLDLPGNFTPSAFIVTNVAGGAEVTLAPSGGGGTTISTNSNAGLVLTTPPYTNPVVIDPGVTVSSTTGDAISGSGGSWTIQNGGTIAGNPSSSRGVFLSGGGSVTNQSSALITGGIGLTGFQVPLTVVNDGSITGSATSGVNAGMGIDLLAGGSVTNQSGGVISADVGIYGWTVATAIVNSGSISGIGIAGIKLAAGGSVINQSNASISGYDGVVGFGAAPTVGNAGSIVGNATAASGDGIRLLAGGSVTNQSGALIAGYNGVFDSGAPATVVNAGTITGNATSAGGKGIDLLAGGSVTNQSGGTISGYTGIYGGPGGVVSVSNAGSIAGLGTSPTGTGFAIDLLDGGWVSNASTGTISGVARAGVIITGASAGTVLNAGLIITSNTRSAVAIEHGGYISNASTGRISSAGGNAIYMSGGFGIVLNAGSITNGGTHIVIDLSSSGFVSNASSGFISSSGGGGAIYTTGGASTVVNAGTLGGSSGIDDTGVLTVVNSGLISVGGSGAININAGSGVVTNSGKIISSTGRGVYIGAGGVVTNQATGTISAGNGTGVRIAAGSGTLINAGKILSPQGLGVQFSDGGAITNQSAGTISGGVFPGVYISGQAGTVANYGTIGGATGGVILRAGGTIVDAGTISGGTGEAVYLGTGFTDRLVLDPGARFTGLVTGGNALGAAAVSTLELASSASAGSLSGIGSTIVNFGSIAFDTGADWFIAGNTSGLAGTISGFAKGDTIEVTGITVTGSSYVNGILTLDEASGTATLDLPGSFTPGEFVVTNVAGGAEITTTATVVAPGASTWTWLGGTTNVDSPSDWALSAGPGNGAGIPETGDTAINNGTLVGYGLIAAALINNGTVEASNNSVPGSSTGGDLEIQGAVSGSGSMTIAPGATLQIDGALGAGQAIAFDTGVPEMLILGAPAALISNPITGFAGGDKIEFSDGITVNSASLINGDTLAVAYSNAVGSIGVYDLTDVTIAVSTPLSFIHGIDVVTGDWFVMPTTYLTWTGASNTNFSNAENWNFGTIVPSLAYYGLFNSGLGGTISGTGAIQGFSVSNTGTWTLAPGTSLYVADQFSIGGGGGGAAGFGALTIGSGSTITSPGGLFVVGGAAGEIATLTVSGGGVLQETATDSPPQVALDVGNATASGTLAAAVGSLVVTGTGSVVNLGLDGLYLGNLGGTGNVTVSQGGSLAAGAPNSNIGAALSIGRIGSGTLTVTDPGSQVTATGVAFIARSVTGTLLVENSGRFRAALDPLGLGGLIIGDGSASGVGGSGAATVTTDGVLDSLGYVSVGVRGTAGQLSVLNGGTVQVGSTLAVGSGGTLSNGVTETGSGTLTIGTNGTVELTGTAQSSTFGVYLGNSNIGTVSTENASATVSGTGALLNTNGNGLAVADYGTAALTVSQGGSVVSGTPNSNLVVALAIGKQGSGTVTVTDPNSQLTANGAVVVGRTGTGSLFVENHGSVVIGLDGLGAGGLNIGGYGTNSTGSLYVGGSGSVFVNTGGDLFSQTTIDVGQNGATGTLTVQGGTVGAAWQLSIGSSTTLAPGATLISPTGTTAVLSATVEAGTGVVNIDAGGLLTVSNLGASGVPDIIVGAGAGATGVLNVTGSGAFLNSVGGTIAIGSAGSGTLDVSNGGSIQAGSFSNGTNGTILLGGGELSATGTSSSTGAITGFGTFIGLLENSGTVAASGGLLEIAGSLIGTGALQIGGGATLRLDVAPTAGQSVSFGTNSELALNAPGAAFNNAITGLDTGDIIEFSNGMTVTSASVVNANTVVVDFHGSGGLSGTYDLTNVDFASGSGEQFSVGVDATTGDSYVQVTSTLPLTISGAVAGQEITGPVTVTPFSTVTIADANLDQTETVTVTLSSAANGTLSNLDGGSYNSATGVYTDTDTAAAVTAALDGLVFKPTADQVAAGQTVTTGFTIAAADTVGASAADSATTVVATSVGPIIADLESDWSNTSNPNSSNPNGTWEYRQGTADLPLVPGAYVSFGGPVWAPSNNSGDLLPALFQATTGEEPVNWQIGDVITHTVDSANGNPSLGDANYLFTSAVSGTFNIVGDVWDASLYYGTSRPQDWALLVDGVAVASGNMNGLVTQTDPNTFDVTNVAFVPGTAVELELYEGASLGYYVGANLTIAGVAAGSVSWLTDTPGNFDDPTRWTGDIVPNTTTDASIDFADRPQVLHSSGNDTVHSLTNTAGDFVMAGGTLTTPDLENDSLMQWSGGAIVLNGMAVAASLTNTGTLTIAPSGQRLSVIGTAAFTNSGTLLVTGGGGVANIDAPLVNTGNVIVTRGTLSLNSGGISNGAGLQGGAGGTLQFGLPAGGGAGNTFTVTGGEYAIGNTTIDNGTLDLSGATSIFFVNSLRIAGAGSLVLGANNATAQNGFTQGPTAWAGATGIPFLSGSGALTVFGGGSLINGVETGTGLTRLFGTNLLGGTIQLDGGRTVENDGWMNWSSGNIVLGAGDATAATHNGTLANLLGATFYVTADGRIGNQGAGKSALNNAGVIAVFAGSGETDIDAAVNNTGYIQAQTGTLSLNGGGTSDGAHLFAANNAVVQFGTLGSGAAGGTFSIASGQYTAADTAIIGGTLDVSAASGAVFADQLKITAGALQLGAQSNAAVQGELLQTGGVLKGSAELAVFGGASLAGGVQSGPATTVLFGTSVLGGSFQLDGGRTVENEGWMNWSSGNIALGSGDPTAATHNGTLANASGATFYVTADGRIGTAGPGSGVLNNAGVLAVFAGVGETDIDALLNSTGYIQAQSGTLSLNGGGSSNAGNLFVAANAVVQFGTAASTGAGGTFSFTGGPYIAGNTVVNGSTLDLSAVSGVSFGNSLTLGSGSLLLGSNFPATADYTQSGGVLSGSGYFYVTAAATLGGGLETGTGRTVLQGGGLITGSVAFDGGYSVENAGALTWSGGSITLGGGDPNASTHVATLINDAGAVLAIETSGTINSAGFAGTGAISNAGTIVSGGLGTTSVYANLFNNGVVEATAGTLVLEQGVGGTGTFLLNGAATLDFVNGAGSNDTMQFLQPGGTLETQALGNFASTVSGFASGDVLDAASVGFVTGTTTVGFNNGTLTVTDGAQSTAFMLTGSYATNGFQIIGSDGHGGTEVGYV